MSYHATLSGEGGNDLFTVFHNTAELNLNGGDGDDTFTVPRLRPGRIDELRRVGATVATIWWSTS